MKKMNVYTINDRVAEESGPPFIAKNDGVATRQFLAMIRDESVLSVNDYRLLRIGEYDPKTSKIESCDIMEVYLPTLEGKS